MDYDELMKKAYEKLPEIKETAERFEIPKVRGHIQGNKTVVTNLSQIAQHIQRPFDHMLKFILKELATPGTAVKNGFIFGSKVPASRINEKIEKYVEEFVICKECGKPDTKLMKEDKFIFKKCMACGSKESVRSIKQ